MREHQLGIRLQSYEEEEHHQPRLSYEVEQRRLYRREDRMREVGNIP